MSSFMKGSSFGNWSMYMPSVSMSWQDMFMVRCRSLSFPVRRQKVFVRNGKKITNIYIKKTELSGRIKESVFLRQRCCDVAVRIILTPTVWKTRDGSGEGTEGGREREKRKTDWSCSFSHFHPMATNVTFSCPLHRYEQRVSIRTQWSTMRKDATSERTDGRTRTHEQTNSERNTTREDWNVRRPRLIRRIFRVRRRVWCRGKERTRRRARERRPVAPPLTPPQRRYWRHLSTCRRVTSRIPPSMIFAPRSFDESMNRGGGGWNQFVY